MGAVLDGIRVLDLSSVILGPMAAQYLGDLGADVIKVEPPGAGDPLRQWRLVKDGTSVWWQVQSRNKRSIALDLRTPEGQDIVRRLVDEADVLVENFRPGTLEGWGLGWEVLSQRNPGLVMLRISGYGQDGPYRDRPGHDLNYLGLTGLLDLSGDADGPPVQSGGQIADLGGGALMAAFGILAALRERDRSGEGQFVDVSMTDGSLSWLAMVAARYLEDGTPPRRGDEILAGGYVCYRPYACADGHVTLGALEPKFFVRLCELIGRPELAERQYDPDAQQQLAGALAAEFAARPLPEWLELFDGEDVCVGPVATLAEAALEFGRRVAAPSAPVGQHTAAWREELGLE